MATYAIGDVQGCYDDLRRLLDRLHFDADVDHLWLAGDLVNRGPDSLGVLRFVRGLGNAARCVLGNHDLHLLAHADGRQRHSHRDTLDDILTAPDRGELLDWLAHRPLMYDDADLGWTMLHAGLPPQWDQVTARACAREVEGVLAGSLRRKFLQHMYGNEPDRWDEDLHGWDRFRFIVNCFTRLRYCTAKGRLGLKYKGAPGTQPDKYLPWFQVPNRRSRKLRIVFGHWSTLGLYHGDGVVALDTGCLWGGRLTALRLDRAKLSLKSIRCSGARNPG